MRRSFILAALIALDVGATSAQAPPTPLRPLSYTRFVLSNGLTVILNPDHASPITAVDIFYGIGSRDDTRGRFGVAHLCEHVLSEGSANVRQPQATFYRTLGGTSAHFAETTEDITHYYVVVPSHQLETVLWTEGDRLRHAFSGVDSASLAATRPVVEQERLSRFENAPLDYGTIRSVVLESLFPQGHPYSNSAQSPLPDLPRLGPTQVKDACAPYYVPNNAVIAVSGDFDPAAARTWIERYFGDIARGAPVTRTPVPTVALASEKRIVLEDPRITVPQFRIVWLGAGYENPDRGALLALASSLSLARVASDGHLNAVGVMPPTSLGRLSKLLVDDRQLATRVIVDNYDVQRAGMFEITIYPRPNASLTTIETLVDSVLSAMATNPVTREELGLFNSYNAVHLATSLQPRSSRADTLAHDQVFTGDPSSYLKQAARARSLTPADVEGARRKYLGAERVVVSLVPAGKLNLISKPDLPYVNATPAPAKKPR